MTVFNGSKEEVLLTYGHTTSVGEVESDDRSGGVRIMVELSEAGVEHFENGLEAIGAFENPEENELRTYYDDEVVYTATLSQRLANVVESGDFAGNIILQIGNKSTADAMKKRLESQGKNHVRKP